MWTIAIRRYLLAMLAGTCIASLSVPPGRAQTSSPTISPDLTIAVNQTPEPQVLQGEPLVITALLSNPGIFSKNVTVLQINPQNGSWANTVKLMVSDSNGAAANWPAQLISSPPGALTLDSHQTGILKWVVSGADANNIAGGRYQVSAMIDTTASAGTTGWKGTATSDVAAVHVNATVAPTNAQLEQKFFSEAIADHLLGNETQANTVLDQLLAQNPTSIRALQLKGTVLTNLGQTQAALDATQQALDLAFAQETNPQEPPTLLLRAASSLRDQIFLTNGPQAVATTTTGTSANVTFSPTDQTISLSATVSSTGGAVTDGTVTFTVRGVGSSLTSSPLTQGRASALFTVPGGSHAGTYPLEASYGGDASFLTSSDAHQTLTIGKAKPAINWNAPASINFGLPLGPGPLNATANVPGNFTYTPAAGSVLPLGSGQLLSVTFAPTDAADYTGATATATINVVKLLGDLNNDGSVGCDDLAIVKASFGKKAGQPGFDPRADVNGDRIVNIFDLAVVARQLPAGTTCP
jgi:Bacterial Ig-like domain (group 3)/Dockerin type I domain